MRRSDWLEALPVALARWLGARTDVGRADCCLMVFDVLERGLGIRLAPRPPYASARGAMRLVRAGGPVVWLQERLPVLADPARASDGDVLALPPAEGGRGGPTGAVGIICGGHLWTMTDGGGQAVLPVSAWLDEPGLMAFSTQDGAG